MKLLTSVVAVATISMGSMASAASWDFGQDAEDFFDTKGYEGSFAQVYSSTGGVADGGGITVDASASKGGIKGVHPFMDSRGNDKPNGDPGDDYAGLGVCSSGFLESGISDCSTNFGSNTGDDNLVAKEILTLTFSKAVRIRDLFIRDSGHDPLTGALWVDAGAGFQAYDIIAGVVQGIANAGFTDTFRFTSDPAVAPNGQIYLSTMTASVPLPAAGWMLLAGLGGIAAMRRRGDK